MDHSSLFDDWYELGSKVLAVKPSLKEDRGAVVHIVPEINNDDRFPISNILNVYIKKYALYEI